MQMDPQLGFLGSEDCLYLNVYRPKHVKAPLPVIVFIHGGAFFYGSALPSVYGPEKFMSNGSVILVTLQYRVGALGFLSTGDCDAPGNVGLKDQNLALGWVKENIERFGGDPDLITLVGQSAGAISVQLHMMSPRSKGLFHRAVMMSGSALIHTIEPPDMAIRLARYQLAAIGLNSVGEMTSEQILLILRSADAAAIVRSIMLVTQLYNPNEVYSVFRPTLEVCNNDETFINRLPNELWRNGEYAQIPWMAGLVQNEATVITLGILNNETLLGYFNANAPNVFPELVGLNSNAAPALKTRFFGGSFTPIWISESNGQRFTDVTFNRY
ncbi:juvenile hormone esterase-like [Ochlerotatus camptorhynchus]|uniref:juvenile hormone esterase-like n=1 Tax=Ochlerotatus camptorhynchus TaxID=644619 RepID=UPI0031E45F77